LRQEEGKKLIDKSWILDSFPMTHSQAICLEKAKFQPHKVYHMSIGKEEILKRAVIDVANDKTDNALPPLNIPNLLLMRNESDTTESVKIKKLFEENYSNWVELDPNASNWALKNTIQTTSETVMERKRSYLDLKFRGRLI
jgi:adenylate kinase family enzyme